jgi:hypothetical protein
MGVGYVFKGQALCDECYQEAVDFEIHVGREREIPPKTKVYKKECEKCHVELEIEEEL